MIRNKLLRPEETKVLDEATGRVSAVVSSEKMDRDGDVIRAEGWNLGSFMKHPVLLSSHDYHSLRSQIGVWESMEVVVNQMKGVARFFTGKGNPEADWAFELAKEKALAFSVGFIPDMEKASPLNEKDVLGTGGMEFKGQELLEVSAVTVPSNPDALQRFVKSPNLHPAIREIAEERVSDLETETRETPPNAADTLIDIIVERVVARLGEKEAQEVEEEAIDAETESEEEEDKGGGSGGNRRPRREFDSEEDEEEEEPIESEPKAEGFDAYAVALSAAEEILSELEDSDE